ncbi:ATP-dependent Clp protease proteolytic subunit [uncultured Tenacibaculum sp.]|uniref:SDH family Clp fold serine proteinase n=1 Tax=uncultured Tenacibaculum sp. TaxID=174713 RepID=UPI0026369DB6|nr:ATP-dependent Clp protease proteolytic subunit [uncultured Tenacibaculum sp.]
MKSTIILDLVGELKETRGIPQFLFCSSIEPSSMFQVRKEILDYKKECPKSDEIDFIINSPGGSPADAYRIIRTLRNNFEKVNIIVPFWAKSAATLLSLGGSEIIMDEFGEFGPLDIQIAIQKDDSPEYDRESALNDEYSVKLIESRSKELYYSMYLSLYNTDDVKINKVELSRQLFEYLSQFYKPLLSQINPYNLGSKKRALDIGQHYAIRVLTEYNRSLPEYNRQVLVDYLVNQCPDHGYVIDFNFISKVLKNVKLSKEISEEYSTQLSEVSSALMDSSDFSFIGFVYSKKELEEILETQEETNQDSSLKEIKSEVKSKKEQNGVKQ